MLNKQTSSSMLPGDIWSDWDVKLPAVSLVLQYVIQKYSPQASKLILKVMAL